MCAEADEGGRTGSPRGSDAGRTRDGDTRAASPETPPCQSESTSRRATRYAALRLQAEVVRAWRAWETTRGTRGRWKMTLPELYLAYIADTGEELRDALLRVAGEPRSNPNRRNVHELLAEHLGDVAAVTAGPPGRFGEKMFHVHFSAKTEKRFSAASPPPRRRRKLVCHPSGEPIRENPPWPITHVSFPCLRRRKRSGPPSLKGRARRGDHR